MFYSLMLITDVQESAKCFCFFFNYCIRISEVEGTWYTDNLRLSRSILMFFFYNDLCDIHLTFVRDDVVR